MHEFENNLAGGKESKFWRAPAFYSQFHKRRAKGRYDHIFVGGGGRKLPERRHAEKENG